VRERGIVGKEMILLRLIDADMLLKKISFTTTGRRIPEYDVDNFATQFPLKDFKDIIRKQPTVDVFANLKFELFKLRQNFKGKEVGVDVNQDYLTGYLSAVSTMEGILAEVEERYKSENL
jgi:hypothetical protein